MSSMEGPSQSSLCDTEVSATTQNIDVDVVNEDGWTPLMIACARNQIELVKGLLDQGANPNFRSTKDKTTPMHCACSGYICMEIPRGHSDHFHFKHSMSERINILRLLVEHGATLTNNSNGLSPLTLAAIYNQSDTVDYFLQNDVSHQLQISNTEKAKAYELLGVACRLNMMIGSGHDKFDPCRLFRRALSIYKEEGIASFSDHKPSEIATSFSLFSTKECKSEEDFDETVCSRTWSVKNQGFLVAERVLPEEIKTRYLFPRLIKHGLDGVLNNGSNAFCLSQGAQILREVIQFEVESNLTVSVLSGLLNGIPTSENPVDDDAMKVCYELLDLCLQVLNKLSPDRLHEMSFDLVTELAHFLYYLAIFDKPSERFESLLQFGERMVTDMRRINNRCESVVHEILILLVRASWASWALCDDFEDDIKFDVERGENRLKHVISRILMCEDATQHNAGDESMLHSLLGNFGSYEEQFTREIALILIRNGCDTKALGIHEETVRDVIYKNITLDQITPEIEELITLISPPTSVLPLEELAARMILRNKIPHEGILPKHLSDIVRGNFGGQCH